MRNTETIDKVRIPTNAVIGEDGLPIITTESTVANVTRIQEIDGRTFVSVRYFQGGGFRQEMYALDTCEIV